MITHLFKLQYLKYLLSILIAFVIFELIYEYNTIDEHDIIEMIHRKNLKAVQIYNERFTFDNWGLREFGEYPFHRCKEKRCFAFKPFKYTQRALENSDGVMVHVPNLFYLNRNSYKRNPKQLWLFYTMESQVLLNYNSVIAKKFNEIFYLKRRSFCSLHYKLTDLDNWFNLTATFKSDSHIVMDYKQFKNWSLIHLDWDYVSSFRSQQLKSNLIKNDILKKTKKPFVFWYVSNCETPSRREKYVNELIKYIDIDIYGSCSNKFKQSKPDPCKNKNLDGEKCDFNLFNSYKFYLAFENSLCSEYTTEKFWKIYTPSRLFKLNIVPVVKGARDYEYKNIALPYSFINADNFNSPKSLADYLNYLNFNDTAYMEYYDSKFDLIKTLKTKIIKNETYEKPRDDFTPFCEICSKLHDNYYLNNHHKNKIIKISEWFNPLGDCWDQDEPNRLFSWITKLFGYCI
jgi:hypothetical protein